MQKKSYVTLGLSAVMAIAYCLLGLSASLPAQKLTLKKESSPAVHASQSVPQKKTAPQKLQRRLPQTASFSFSEDFSKFTGGTEDEPDRDNIVASFYSEKNAPIFVPSELTSEEGWSGNRVYQAGGACALLAPGFQVGGTLNTPLGDYSGHVRIKFRIRAIGPVPNPDYTADHDANVFVTQCINGVMYTNMANVSNIKVNGYGRNAEFFLQFHLDKEDGWKDIDVEWDNSSSDPQGFIQINAYGEVEVDDIEVTVDDSFLAQPTCNPVSNYTNEGFDITWKPIRGVTEYEVNVTRKELKGDEPQTFTTDFENGEIPSWIEITGSENCKIQPANSQYDSKYLELADGAVVTFPSNGSKWEDMSCMLLALSDEENTGIVNSRVTIEAFDGVEWQYVERFDGFNLMWPEPLVFSEFFPQENFTSNYFAFRFVIQGFNAPASLVLDNIEIKAGIPQEEITVIKDKAVQGTPFRVEDIDPYLAYYYTVSSVKDGKKATTQPIYALGVARPEALEATDVDRRGSYTANWKETPRATDYQAISFGVRTPQEDTEDFVILEEKFDNLKTNAKDPTNPDYLYNMDAPLDEHTGLPGWYGSNNTMIVGQLGCDQGSRGDGYIRLPLLDLTHDSSYKIHVKAYGNVNDLFKVLTDDNDYAIEFKPDGNSFGGIVEGTFEVPEHGHLREIYLYTEGGSAWMLDEVRITQNVKKDRNVLTWLADTYTDGQTFSYRFTDHGDFDFEKFGFGVYAYRVEGKEVAKSDMSEPVVFSMNASGVMNIDNSDVAKVKAIYGADGTRRQSIGRGLNIVVRTDGSVEKIMK